MPHMNASVPQHIYGRVSRLILTGLDPQEADNYENCVVFGITSLPSRALHFSILLESRAQWARIPLHMLRWATHTPPNESQNYEITHPLHELQMWDCHGWDFSVVQYDYLREMGCEYLKRDGTKVPASYWFTLDHTDNGYSQYPPEHKCYHLLLLEDGSDQIAAQPNNRILWNDDSFVKKDFPLDYKVMPAVTWHSEVSRINAQETAFTKDP